MKWPPRLPKNNATENSTPLGEPRELDHQQNFPLTRKEYFKTTNEMVWGAISCRTQTLPWCYPRCRWDTLGCHWMETAWGVFGGCLRKSLHEAGEQPRTKGLIPSTWGSQFVKISFHKSEPWFRNPLLDTNSRKNIKPSADKAAPLLCTITQHRDLTLSVQNQCKFFHHRARTTIDLQTKQKHYFRQPPQDMAIRIFPHFGFGFISPWKKK